MTAAPARAQEARRPEMKRTCACGTHTIGGITCAHCSQGAPSIQRAALPGASAGVVPGAGRAVAEALASPAEPMAPGVLAFMERRLSPAAQVPDRTAAEGGGFAVASDDNPAEREARRNADRIGAVPGRQAAHDFSSVRLHAGPRANLAAHRLGARAFTFGEDIVFGAGSFAPHTPDGQRLIAHELTHVAQQRAAAVTAPPPLQRESFGRTLRDIAFFIPSLFGAELNYGDDELAEYLDGVVASGHIEGGYYSDDKARQIVQRWQAGNPRFVLDTNKKRLLIQEMQDGIVTDGDRRGIMSLLESATPAEASVLLSPAAVDFAALLKDLGHGDYGTRLITWFIRTPSLHKDLVGDQFVAWFVSENFDKRDQPLATKIMQDILAAGPGLDFSDEKELKAEVFKRLRVSQLLTESQAQENGFDYPGNMTEQHGCDGYVPNSAGGGIRNARVNKAARPYWNGPYFDPAMLYYFVLSEAGRNNAFAALTTLFTPQKSICDKTLFHCDYLVNVIQFRAYAESLGEKTFNRLVAAGTIDMWLTYTGFPDPRREPAFVSPKAQGFQQGVVVGSRSDLLIGDHVVFWNHLAFDGLNVKVSSDWRLENAVLVDKDPSGADLFQGHGSGPPITEHSMLSELLVAYNDIAKPAIDITAAIDRGEPKENERQTKYPQVSKQQGKWVVVDPGAQPARAGQLYELRLANKDNPEAEPLLPGLRDPLNMSRLGPVDRPIESAPGPAPRPPS